MSVQVEKLEKNMAKLTVEVPAEQFEAALKTSYNKNKNKFNIPGFRKGKAPQAMIEKMYGSDIFHYDAVNDLFPEAYEKSVLHIEPKKLHAVLCVCLAVTIVTSFVSLSSLKPKHYLYIGLFILVSIIIMLIRYKNVKAKLEQQSAQ